MALWNGLLIGVVVTLTVAGEVMGHRQSVCWDRRSELRLHCNPHGFIHVQKVMIGFTNDTQDCTNPDALAYNASCHVITTMWPRYLTCELQEDCDLDIMGLSLHRCGDSGADSNFAIVEYTCLAGPADRISCVYGSACSGNGSWALADDAISVSADGGTGSGSGSVGSAGSGTGSEESAGSSSGPTDSGSVPTHWGPPKDPPEYYDQDWFLSSYDSGEDWEGSGWYSSTYDYYGSWYDYWSDWWQNYESSYDYSYYETPDDWEEYYSDIDWSYSDWAEGHGGTADSMPGRRKRQALESTLLQKIIPGGHSRILQRGDIIMKDHIESLVIQTRTKRESAPSGTFPGVSIYLSDWPLLGYIVSPNFPHEYPDNLDGLCHLQTVQGAEIHLQFDRFHVESDDACIWDYLTLRTEHHAVHLCDKLVPGTRRSLGTQWAQLHFHTDESLQESGFLITYWATHPNGEHAKIGAWCGPLNDTERYLSMIDPEEEVLNHQFQLPTPSSQADGGSTTVTSVTLIGAVSGGVLVLIILVAVVTICLCTRTRNTPAKPMQPAPVISKAHIRPPPDCSGLSGPPDGRLSVINQYEALGAPPPPPSCAPPSYERPSRTLYPTAPINEEIYDEINHYQPRSDGSYLYPTSSGRPTGLAFNNRAYENETPKSGLCPPDRGGSRSPDDNVYSSVKEDYYINMNNP